MKKILLISFIAITSLCFVTTDVPMGLNVGDIAPDFSGKNQSGKEINLKKLLKSNTVVLIFYRGEWCPFCNKQLKELEDSMTFITAKGAAIIAVSPEKTENVAKTIEKTKAKYDILSDQSLKIMNAYKVAFEVDEKSMGMYKKYGIDFNEKNGANGNHLPVPTVYIINKSGKITYKHFDENFKVRPSVKEILNNL
jgi:peroxiredoxin